MCWLYRCGSGGLDNAASLSSRTTTSCSPSRRLSLLLERSPREPSLQTSKRSDSRRDGEQEVVVRDERDAAFVFGRGEDLPGTVSPTVPTRSPVIPSACHGNAQIPNITGSKDAEHQATWEAGGGARPGGLGLGEGPTIAMAEILREIERCLPEPDLPTFARVPLSFFIRFMRGHRNKNMELGSHTKEGKMGFRLCILWKCRDIECRRLQGSECTPRKLVIYTSSRQIPEAFCIRYPYTSKVYTV
jgi:hypothetical protein